MLFVGAGLHDYEMATASLKSRVFNLRLRVSQSRMLNCIEFPMVAAECLIIQQDRLFVANSVITVILLVYVLYTNRKKFFSVI